MSCYNLREAELAIARFNEARTSALHVAAFLPAAHDEIRSLRTTITTLTAEVERLRGEVVESATRLTEERELWVARCEKAEASICKTCFDEDRTVALIASWLARKANKARQVGRTGEQQVFGELADDICAGAWRAKEPV